MPLPLSDRLRDTARRIRGGESIHLGNLYRTLVEAADELERRRPPPDQQPVAPWPRRPPLDAVGVQLSEGRGKVDFREKP